MNRVRWQLDKEGRVTAWSPDAAAFFHLPAEEALEAYRALMRQLVESGQKLEAKSLFSQYQTRMEREGLPIDPDLARLVQPA